MIWACVVLNEEPDNSIWLFSNCLLSILDKCQNILVSGDDSDLEHGQPTPKLLYSCNTEGMVAKWMLKLASD